MRSKVFMIQVKNLLLELDFDLKGGRTRRAWDSYVIGALIDYAKGR